MDRFWRLLESSVLMSGLIAGMMVGTVCYMAISQLPIPDVIVAGFGVIIGFFFGARKKQDDLATQNIEERGD